MCFLKQIIFTAAIIFSVVSSFGVLAKVAAQVPPVTLLKPTTAEKAPDADGFIRRWLILEPIPANGVTDSAVQTLVKKELFLNQFTVVPSNGDKVKVGETDLIWHAVDTVNYNVNLFHFARSQGKKTSDVLFWAVTVINSPQEMRDVRLSIGSNAASIWWLNGNEVIGIYGDRQAVIDDGVSKRLTLKKGQNIIRAAIVNGGGATDFCARLLDANDNPIKNITVRLENSSQSDKLSAEKKLPLPSYEISDSKSPKPAFLISHPQEWLEPFEPFKIAGNLYYVGTRGLANYLIATPKGHILINSDLEENVPQIKASVEKLGFKFTDIKILLISHGHWDHNAASDTVKKLTGAKYFVMEQDVPNVESGGKTDFEYGNEPIALYKPTKVDRVLHDGNKVKLGGTTLVAHLTPGHTKGCTTWTLKVKEDGKIYNAVIIGSPNVNPGYKLVNNAAYPNIAEDYEKMFRVLKALPVDIFLGSHGNYFGMEAKYERFKKEGFSVFIDREGYYKYVIAKELEFRKELAKQKAALTK